VEWSGDKPLVILIYIAIIQNSVPKFKV